MLYLLKYIFESLTPNILYMTTHKQFDELLQKINVNPLNNNNKVYDIILNENFDLKLYDNLIFDGFYIFLNKFNDINKYEFLIHNNYYIIKKSNFEPYFLSNESENNTIALRNFGNNFNIKPYMPPYEIINHPEIILNLCKEYNVKTYLELGVRNSPISKLLMDFVPTIVGVDINNTCNFNGIFNCMTTDNFFTINKTKFDMIFIDACHDFEVVCRDLDNSIEFINDNGIILLHDTYPINQHMTSCNLCSNSYLIVKYIKKNYTNFQLLNIPISPGLCIVKK